MINQILWWDNFKFKNSKDKQGKSINLDHFIFDMLYKLTLDSMQSYRCLSKISFWLLFENISIEWNVWMKTCFDFGLTFLNESQFLNRFYWITIWLNFKFQTTFEFLLAMSKIIDIIIELCVKQSLKTSDW